MFSISLLKGRILQKSVFETASACLRFVFSFKILKVYDLPCKPVESIFFYISSFITPKAFLVIYLFATLKRYKRKRFFASNSIGKLCVSRRMRETQSSCKRSISSNQPYLTFELQPTLSAIHSTLYSSFTLH